MVQGWQRHGMTLPHNWLIWSSPEVLSQESLANLCVNVRAWSGFDQYFFSKIFKRPDRRVSRGPDRVRDVPDIDVLSLTVLGAVVGIVLRSRLARLDHRLDEERELGRPPSWWVVPVTAIASGLVWQAISPGNPVIVPAVYVLAGWVMVALAFIDLDVHRLPDRIQLPAYPTLLALLVVCSIATGDGGALVRAVLAGVALFVLYLFLALLPGGGIGFGDVKLAGLLGMLLGWLSWTHVMRGTVAAFLIGGLVAALLLALRRVKRDDEFPYGPPMLVGAAGALIAPLVLRSLA